LNTVHEVSGGGVLYKALSLFLLCLIGKEVFMNRYDYEGPVMEFDRCISNNWKGTTFAPTEKKAKSNLAYQYKKKHGKIASTKISLPGKVRLVG
jgi:hypothetical protein